MSIFVHGGNKVFLGGSCEIIPDDIAIASSGPHWATRSIVPNPANKWIIGRYAQADNANNNNQYWAFSELQEAQPTLSHAPMNLQHQNRRVVGAFVDTEMMYPIGAKADDASSNPYIEALGVFWKARFHEELAMVEAAYAEGKLFFSMECVSKDVEIVLPDGRSEKFAWAGMQDPTYGEFNDPQGVRKFIQPHFLGGALIIPPGKPGWDEAEIEALAKYTDEHQNMASDVYENLKKDAPQLDESERELVALAYLSSAMQAESTEELIKEDNVTKIMDEDNYAHSNGGDINVSDTVKTYSEADVNAAVEAAVEGLQTQITALTESADAEAREAELAEISTKHDEAIAELRVELDAAVLKAEEATTKHDEIVATQAAEELAVAEAATRESRREERLAKVEEVASFPEEYIEANAGRWTDMDDETFEAYISDFAAAQEAKATAKANSEDDSEEVVEVATAMKHVAAEGSDEKVDTLDSFTSLMSRRGDWIDTV